MAGQPTPEIGIEKGLIKGIPMFNKPLRMSSFWGGGMFGGGGGGWPAEIRGPEQLVGKPLETSTDLVAQTQEIRLGLRGWLLRVGVWRVFFVQRFRVNNGWC